MKMLLTIMTKEATPGQVKTRLCPPLTPDYAAALYNCFTQDRLSEMARITRQDKAIAVTPESAVVYFNVYESFDYRIFPQRGVDLGERMHHIFKDMLKENYDAVVIIGCDSPDLPVSIIHESFDLLSLDNTDLVLGPAQDGGYYLIGMKQPCRTLFENIPWGTENVLSITLKKANDLGIRIQKLPVWRDIDTFEDLIFFYNTHRDQSHNSEFPGRKTLAFLEQIPLYQI